MATLNEAAVRIYQTYMQHLQRMHNDANEFLTFINENRNVHIPTFGQDTTDGALTERSRKMDEREAAIQTQWKQLKDFEQRLSVKAQALDVRERAMAPMSVSSGHPSPYETPSPMASPRNLSAAMGAPEPQTIPIREETPEAGPSLLDPSLAALPPLPSIPIVSMPQ